MPPSAKDDVTALKELLLWARDHKIRLDGVAVGSVSIASIADHVMAEKQARRQTREQLTGARDPYQHWGGDALAATEEMLSKDGALVEDDDEDEVAVTQ